MKTKPITILTSIFLLLFCFSCHKPDKTPKYYLPQDLKDYVMFPVGSYWVYKDSLSGATDSIVLTKQETYIEEPGHVWDFYWENLRQEFYSSYYMNFNGGGYLF